MKKKTEKIGIFDLFITFLKIGLFTFGGGYAMIPLIQKEVTTKKGWISNAEMLDILAISESTPGPISINTATYIGFKKRGIIGSVISTIGLVFPSFVIILLVSSIYESLINNPYITKAFSGIKVAVVILIFNAFLKFIKQIENKKINITIVILCLIISFLFDYLNISINIGKLSLSISFIMILLCLLIGLIESSIISRRQK